MLLPVLTDDMASCLWRRTLSQQFKTLGRIYNQTHVRTLLSPAYYSSELWKQRLETPLLKKVNIANFAMKLQEKLDKEGQVASIDIDILANKIDQLENSQLDFAQNLLHRFRHTKESINLQDSTSHAIIRALLDMDESERLLDILQDKINYGIFLDQFSATLLMDFFIQKEQYKQAAQVAFDLMLQEDFGSELSRHMAWYACHLYWRNLAPEAEDAPEAEEAEADEEEEVKLVKVDWVRTHWYDDHWDLPSDVHKAGKTLVLLTRGRQDILGHSYQLLGCALWSKWQQGLELLTQLADSKDSRLAHQAMEAFESSLAAVVTKEPQEPKDLGEMTMEDVLPYTTPEDKECYTQQLQDIKSRLQSQGQVVDEDLEAQLKTLVLQVAAQSESKHISQQEELFKQWDSNREKLVKEQIETLRVHQHKVEIAKRLLDLTEKEERLRYFEVEDQIKVAQMKAPKIRPIEEVREEEVFVAAPSERGKIN